MLCKLQKLARLLWLWAYYIYLVQKISFGLNIKKVFYNFKRVNSLLKTFCTLITCVSHVTVAFILPAMPLPYYWWLMGKYILTSVCSRLPFLHIEFHMRLILYNDTFAWNPESNVINNDNKYVSVLDLVSILNYVLQSYAVDLFYVYWIKTINLQYFKQLNCTINSLVSYSA